ncbi:hypothetical protein FF38_14120 [Lucilia cuprina]|uniref:Uncharacterized protein n=1 Tax=Lucilia cuprina TaxID=7375 RepID=A0A0L0C7I3_LUCCU|nr:hypothetical protein FF38_14120 [Lucilia cuprina]
MQHLATSCYILPVPQQQQQQRQQYLFDCNRNSLQNLDLDNLQLDLNLKKSRDHAPKYYIGRSRGVSPCHKNVPPITKTVLAIGVTVEKSPTCFYKVINNVTSVIIKLILLLVYCRKQIVGMYTKREGVGNKRARVLSSPECVDAGFEKHYGVATETVSDLSIADPVQASSVLLVFTSTSPSVAQLLSSTKAFDIISLITRTSITALIATTLISLLSSLIRTEPKKWRYYTALSFALKQHRQLVNSAHFKAYNFAVKDYRGDASLVNMIRSIRISDMSLLRPQEPHDQRNIFPYTILFKLRTVVEFMTRPFIQTSAVTATWIAHTILQGSKYNVSSKNTNSYKGPRELRSFSCEIITFCETVSSHGTKINLTEFDAIALRYVSPLRLHDIVEGYLNAFSF